MKHSRMLWASVAATAALTLTPEYSLAQPPTIYTVCIGQIQRNCPACNVTAGPHMKCTGYDAWYNCTFADNPLVKVRAFCKGKGSNPAAWRTSSVNGNKCGYSVIGITCK